MEGYAFEVIFQNSPLPDPVTSVEIIRQQALHGRSIVLFDRRLILRVERGHRFAILILAMTPLLASDQTVAASVNPATSNKLLIALRFVLPMFLVRIFSSSKISHLSLNN